LQRGTESPSKWQTASSLWRSPFAAWVPVRKDGMDDQTKLNLAVTRFAAFASNLPLSPDEDDILEYHDIIGLFEEACRQDLSQFRIAPGRIQPEADRATIASVGGCWQTRHHKKNCVECGYFRGQVRGLISCLMTVLHGRPC
jgi:hypothetical protein